MADKARITRDGLVDGLYEFGTKNVIPALKDNKAVAVIGTVLLHQAKNNEQLQNLVLCHPVLKAALNYDESSKTYCVDGILEDFEKTVGDMNGLPVTLELPSIIAPETLRMTLNKADISALRDIMRKHYIS